MNPNEFFKKKLPETNGQKFVLGLFPNKSKEIFEKSIQPIIESQENELTFKSYLRKGKNLNLIASILDDIQNASLIVTDVSGFEPNVMYELGIALVKNEKHILIADTESYQNLPFFLQNIRIHEYQEESSNELMVFIEEQVNDLVPEEKHKCIFSEDSKDAISEINRYVHEGSYSAALLFWEKLKQKEPDNVCVDELKAEIFIKKGLSLDKERKLKEASEQFDEARKQYDVILESDQLSKSFRSNILLEVAQTFLNYRPRRVEEALKFYSQAESYYNRSSHLYEKWAYAYHLSKNHEKAYEKILLAMNLSKNNARLIKLCQFYHNWKINDNYGVGLNRFLRINTTGEGGTQRPPEPPHSGSNYSRFIREKKLGANCTATITRVWDAGIRFSTLGAISGVEGFISSKSIQQSNYSNYKAIFKVDDTISFVYSGNNHDRSSIFANKIKKSN